MFEEPSDTHAASMSSEDEPTFNLTSNVTDRESSGDVTDGASSPNQTSASAPTLSSDEEFVFLYKIN